MQFLSAPRIPVVTALPLSGRSGEIVFYSGSFYKWDGSEWDQFVNSVAGKTGAVTLVKGDVGLANVDNTSDANKPISSATQAALDLKLDDSQAGSFGLSLLGTTTAAAGTALLNTFTLSEKGLVPAPVTSTGRFLKDDGTWGVPIADPEPAWLVSATSTGISQNITLPESGLTANDVLVTINGLAQDPSDYSVVGTTLTITAPTSGLEISVRMFKVGGGSGIQPAYSIPMGFTTTPISSEKLLIHVFAESVVLPADFLGFAKYVGVNPSATFVVIVKKNGASVGTLTISTSGTVTGSTSGLPITFVEDDVLIIEAPSIEDTSIEDWAITLKGTRL